MFTHLILVSRVEGNLSDFGILHSVLGHFSNGQFSELEQSDLRRVSCAFLPENIELLP